MRVKAVDVLRGITVFLMLLVEFIPDSETAPKQLVHSEFNGLTLADWVFPTFLFLMGASIYFSLSKNGFKPTKAAVIHILRRSVILILIDYAISYLGVTLSYYNNLKESDTNTRIFEAFFTHFDEVRYSGALTRIAITYLVVSLLVLQLNHKFLPYICATILAVYYFILELFNGFAPDSPALVFADNLILGPTHIYTDDWSNFDPEGVLSTPAAVVTVILGFMVGRALMNTNLEKLYDKLIAASVVLFTVGFFWSYICPINKKIWSPTFVLITAALDILLVAVIHYIVDYKKHTKLVPLAQVFGANALISYIGCEVINAVTNNIDTESSTSWTGYNSLFHQIYQDRFLPLSFMPADYASLLYALLWTLIIYALAALLYWRKIFVKI
ncbi:membrane protein [Actinomycetota bacterium]|nr:membrane protein [Actinomycetota bacterium]